MEPALYAPGFAEHLAAQGYTDKSITGQLGLLAHLDRWLDAQGLAPGALSVEVVDRYLTARRAEGRRLYWSRRGLKPLFDYLSRVGEAPMPAPPPVTTAHERVLAPYRYYLVEERKLMAATVSNNEYYAGLFLSGLPIPVRVDLSSQWALSRLSASSGVALQRWDSRKQRRRELNGAKRARLASEDSGRRRRGIDR